MKDTARDCLLFFVKDPESGGVKTRLAAVLGQDKATELYRCFVLDMLDAIDSMAQMDADLVICFTPARARSKMETWLGKERSYLAQEGEDLGQRMGRAFNWAFSRGHTRVVLLGSDLPGLPPHVVATALDDLGRHGAVLGPARDGGYYLIGFQRESFLPTVFENMAWGGLGVCQETLARIRDTGGDAGIEPALAPDWQDIDRPEDLEALRQDPEMKQNAPRTFAALASCTIPLDRSVKKSV